MALEAVGNVCEHIEAKTVAGKQSDTFQMPEERRKYIDEFVNGDPNMGMPFIYSCRKVAPSGAVVRFLHPVWSN